jgi:hypothetical protein
VKLVGNCNSNDINTLVCENVLKRRKYVNTLTASKLVCLP